MFLQPSLTHLWNRNSKYRIWIFTPIITLKLSQTTTSLCNHDRPLIYYFINLIMAIKM